MPTSDAASTGKFVWLGAPGEGDFSLYMFDIATSQTRVFPMPPEPWPTYTFVAQLAAVRMSSTANESSWALVAVSGDTRSHNVTFNAINIETGVWSSAIYVATGVQSLAPGYAALGTDDGRLITLTGGSEATKQVGMGEFGLLSVDFASSSHVVANVTLPASVSSSFFALWLGD